MEKPRQPNIEVRRVKAVALPVLDAARANEFYGKTLGLPVAMDGDKPFGYQIGDTYLLLKPDWYAAPSAQPSPRITLEVADARAVQEQLRALGVELPDPVAASDGGGHVGSFLDSEGNKIWYCSYT